MPSLRARLVRVGIAIGARLQLGVDGGLYSELSLVNAIAGLPYPSSWKRPETLKLQYPRVR